MLTTEPTVAEKKPRIFLPEDFTLNNKEQLLPFLENLNNRALNSVEELQKWLKDWSELEAVLEEDLAWRYIKMNITTTDEKLAEDYRFFVQEIEPILHEYNNKYNQKLANCEHIAQLGDEYAIYIRSVKKQLELFREENIPLLVEVQTKAQEFGNISAAMAVTINGKELTLQQAGKHLEKQDRAERKTAYDKITERRLADKEKLDTLFNELTQLRHQIANNAGHTNFRDYKFEDMGRFDYTKEDCFDFHEAIAKEIVPIVKTFQEERLNNLGYDELRPWDTRVDPEGKPELTPFTTGKELLNKTVECFNKVHPKYANYIATMDKMQHLDLESKTGKAPGGFNYPLYEVGVPFIYMNAVGAQHDVTTMVHEGGHAIHSFVSRDLALTSFKSLPSEVAELASMSMELISMEYWDVFYTNAEDLKRAKKEQLESVISLLPWIASVDQFQHWIYENPNHTVEQRTKEWTNIQKRFSTSMVNWDGYETALQYSWQRQLHIYEVPFYYIEYAMAQLGAIAVWRNYKTNPAKALQDYENALSLGYTKTIPEIYKTAGIEFNFSVNYIKELADFVKDELEQL